MASKLLRGILPVFLTFAFLPSCSTGLWPVEEKKISSSLPETYPEAILLCWEKPVEQFKVLSEMKVSLTPAEAEDYTVLTQVVQVMKEKAARRGANGLLLRHRKYSALYDAHNSLNIQTFIQDDPQSGSKYLESKAIWIEETRGTHGGDEADESALPTTQEWQRIY